MDTSKVRSKLLKFSKVFLCIFSWVMLAHGSFGQGQENSPPAQPNNKECLEALQTGRCVLLWEVDATSATGTTGQSNSSTAPNILVKLNYQWHSPVNQNVKAELKRAAEKVATPAEMQTIDSKYAPVRSDHFVGRVRFETGYTQVVASTKVQATATGGGGSTSTVCPSSSSSSCTAAVPQQAFIANLGTSFGWSTASKGKNVFAEFGIGARGSFQYLVPSNKVVQNGGLTYVDLGSNNSANAVGFYEATAHFRLAQLNHNVAIADTAKIQNVSDLIVFEAGYQNNRGLQGLSTSSGQTDTRNRYVARLSVNPEINQPTHTQITMGVEYSAGLSGGPHVVQLFFGTNLNPKNLFQKSATNNGQ